MKALVVFLICIAATSPQKYQIDPILRQENVLSTGDQYKYGFDSKNQNVEQYRTVDGLIRGSYSYLDDKGQIQHIEYIAGPDGYHVYNANLPITVSPNTETPEVEAARIAHEENYKAIVEAQKRVPPKLEHVQYEQPFEITAYNPMYTTSTTPIPFIQSYLDATQNYPVKNRFATLEETRRPFPLTNRPNNNNRNVNTLKMPTVRKFYQTLEANTVAPHRPEVLKITPQSHLEALKKAIANQLVAYRNAPQSHEPDDVQYEAAYKTELYSPLQVKHYDRNSIGNSNEMESENNRKLAVIAAARALMKLLNDNK